MGHWRLRSMFPFLTYPLALLALASVPTLAGIYVLRNRFRRRQVSSLMLWRFNIQSKEGGVKVHRIQFPLVFFLELLALVLLVTAATGPRWQLPLTARPLIVVLDDSISMRAVRQGRSARDQAMAFLRERLTAAPPPSIRFILAGTKEQLLGASLKSWSEAEALLAQWNCWAAAAAINPSITLAAEMGNQQANIMVISDHPPADPSLAGNRLEWHSFGASIPNLAFVNASRSAYLENDRCLLEVANYSDANTTAKILLRSGTNQLSATELSIGPWARQKFVFQVPSSTPLLEASIATDALVEDNVVQLLPPLRPRVRVQVAMTNEALGGLLTRTLEATGLRAPTSDDPELVIHSSPALPAGSNAWSLRWMIPADATAYTGPFVIDTAHPLAQGLGLQGVVWAGAPTTNIPGYLPVILAGNIPLLSEREDAIGRHHLVLNLSPDLSTIAGLPDWPAIFWNLLDWRASRKPGLAEANARLGSDLLLRTTGEPVEIRRPDGTIRSFPQPGRELLIQTPLPGLYSVTMGTTKLAFAVNTLAANESDLAGCKTATWGEFKDDQQRRFEYASVLWIFVLAALATLVGHLFLVTSKRGASQ